MTQLSSTRLKTFKRKLKVIIKLSPKFAFVTFESSFAEEEAVYDKNQPIGDQGLRARALYDYQAGRFSCIDYEMTP